MKKIIFLICFFFSVANGQIFQPQAGKIYMNVDLIKLYTKKLNEIKSINGKTTIEVPYQKTTITGALFTNIDGFVVQYKKSQDEIQVLKSACRIYEFDFKNKKVKKDLVKMNDDNDFLKPVSGLEAKIKAKEKIKP